MKEQYKNLELINNQEEKRFEMEVDGYLAMIYYREHPGVMTLLHTEVPPELEGGGVGSAIIEKTLNDIEQKGLKLEPICPFVVAFLKRHPEWKRLLAPGFGHL